MLLFKDFNKPMKMRLALLLVAAGFSLAAQTIISNATVASAAISGASSTKTECPLVLPGGDACVVQILRVPCRLALWWDGAHGYVAIGGCPRPMNGPHDNEDLSGYLTLTSGNCTVVRDSASDAAVGRYGKLVSTQNRGAAGKIFGGSWLGKPYTP